MKRPADAIVLSKEQKANAATKIKEYVLDDLDIEIGNLQADIFVDFITNNIGMYYYNTAVADSLSFMTERMEDLYLLMKEED